MRNKNVTWKLAAPAPDSARRQDTVTTEPGAGHQFLFQFRTRQRVSARHRGGRHGDRHYDTGRNPGCGLDPSDGRVRLFRDRLPSNLRRTDCPHSEALSNGLRHKAGGSNNPDANGSVALPDTNSRPPRNIRGLE